MLKMTEICQARDKLKMVQLFFPVLKKPFWLKTILIYFMLQWRSRINFITSRLCSELKVISLHRACACSLQAYGPKSLSLQALKNTGVWTTLIQKNTALSEKEITVQVDFLTLCNLNGRWGRRFVVGINVRPSDTIATLRMRTNAAIFWYSRSSSLEVRGEFSSLAVQRNTFKSFFCFFIEA